MITKQGMNVTESVFTQPVFIFPHKAGIYLLESGLGKPEFLSEGNARMKKANQLMQKMMDVFYDFIIPG